MKQVVREGATVVLGAALALAVAGCGGGGKSEEATGGESTTETAIIAGDPVAGKEVFLNVGGCGSCHTFADAGTTGSVGPNLDDSQPTEELVIDRVTNGRGAMPSYADRLTEQQIADVAAYVSQGAGQ